MNWCFTILPLLALCACKGRGSAAQTDGAQARGDAADLTDGLEDAASPTSDLTNAAGPDGLVADAAADGLPSITGPDGLVRDVDSTDVPAGDLGASLGHDSAVEDLRARDAAVSETDKASALTSIEFGRADWGPDNCVRADAPAGGTLFSVWTKIPDDVTSYPYTRGNMDVYLLRGKTWYFRCLVGNLRINSASSASFNANSMLFTDLDDTWVNEYSYYQSDGSLTESMVRGWVWAAWQVIVNSDSFKIRQWLKFGLDGDVMAAGESSPTFAEIRSDLVSQRGWTQTKADAWSAADATSFQVGKDPGYLCHARMSAMQTVPTLADLDAIARSNKPDTSAWADYQLNWVDGAPNLTDQSGHGRPLSIQAGGNLYQGVAGPAF